MSRIGKQPISLPANVTLSTEGEMYVFTGPKGTLTVPMFAGVALKQTENELNVELLDKETQQAQAFYGLLRVLAFNAATGVSQGWSKNLELHGVGMRAALNGANLNLSLGFSHPVLVDAPEGITFNVVKNVVSVSGIDKQLVGETAAKIRRLRKPEPYKGKGIRYADEYVRRKAGKTGKAAK